MSLQRRLLAATALSFLLTIVLATVTIGGAHTLLLVPQEPWAPISLAWLGVLACAALTLSGAWHIASGLLALVATRDADVASSRLGQALLHLVARRGAPVVRRTVAGSLLLGIATSSPAVAQGAVPADDLGWSPVSTGTTSIDPTPTDTAAPAQETRAESTAGPSPDTSDEAPPPATPQAQSPSTPPTAVTSVPGAADGSAVPAEAAEQVPLRPAQARPSEHLPQTPPAQDHASTTPDPVGATSASTSTNGTAQRGPAATRATGSHHPLPRSSSTQPQRPVALPSRPTTSTVTVRPGDSLWTITRELLETGSRTDVSDAEVLTSWPALYELNVQVIGPDPSLIRPGTVLTVPEGVTR
ncbi:LysM peptidoglycan-binding domain-containing protein [Actinomyces faecalis]|uniref:LysM peptidoglycan-binding domain-containing protein n=1 Tax=Actinomyces faecalis TaxID=2722820 RepID=UPI00155582B3|nr:LysM domain-containing protein [Actinomyces faecalis]